MSLGVRLLAGVPGLQAERGASAQPDPPRPDRVADRRLRAAGRPGRGASRAAHGERRRGDVRARP